jgi:hypothetical protein
MRWCKTGDRQSDDDVRAVMTLAAGVARSRSVTQAVGVLERPKMGFGGTVVPGLELQNAQVGGGTGPCC